MEPNQYQILENLLDPNQIELCNWTIKKSNLGGRGLFATKFIEKGTLIFENKPLAVGPRGDYATNSFCTVCYKISDVVFKCNVCLLLLCSKECEVSLKHKKICDFFDKNWLPKANCDRKSETICSVLIYLHLLSSENNKDHVVTDVFKMLQMCKDIRNTQEIDALYNNYDIPNTQRNFISVINSILKINSFRIANNPQEKKIPLRGLYPLSSFLNHSCIPNTRNIFKKDYMMSVFASKDIEIGEEIVTCYTGLLWSTPARRSQLHKSKGFWCKCKRCEDRTEMGTNLSALKCLDKDCVGVLLPISPTDHRKDWICDNCETKVPANRICIVQSALGSLVGSLDLDEQFRLESVVLERLSKFIPYSNHIFAELRLRLALRVGSAGKQINELSEQRLALKESLCRGTLRSLAALGAGDAHLRGLLLYHLHAALAERARRSPELYDELKSEIESSIEQAYSILHGDISVPPDLELRRRYLGPGCDKPQQERFFILNL